MRFFPQNPNSVPSCIECGFLRDCGGLEGDGYDRGCFQRCDSYCRVHGCDVVCPSSPLPFETLFADVKGICTVPTVRLTPFDEVLPTYIPQIHHGSRRRTRLNEPWVTVPLYSIAGRGRRGIYRVRFRSAEEMREELKLSESTKVIVTSAVPDRHVEDFWMEHVARGIPEEIAELGIAAMTAPNFSFMLDVPRTNSLYNLSRIFRVCEAISAAGIPILPHLNASTEKDWQRWEEFLRAQSDISRVCIEFQTGASSQSVGDRYLTNLAELQRRLGRCLHPLVMGGVGRLAKLCERFSAFTVADSTPFVRTMKRKALEKDHRGKWKWKHRASAPGASLGRYLSANIESYREQQLNRVSTLRRQLELQSLLDSVGHTELIASQRQPTPSEILASQ